MDVASSPSVLELENSLALLAVKGTVTAVTAKLNGIRQEKNAEVIRSTYDEIVNELLEERAQAIQIAQALKDELNRVEIDEAGIESLDATIGRAD